MHTILPCTRSCTCWQDRVGRVKGALKLITDAALPRGRDSRRMCRLVRAWEAWVKKLGDASEEVRSFIVLDDDGLQKLLRMLLLKHLLKPQNLLSADELLVCLSRAQSPRSRPMLSTRTASLTHAPTLRPSLTYRVFSRPPQRLLCLRDAVLLSHEQVVALIAAATAPGSQAEEGTPF